MKTIKKILMKHKTYNCEYEKVTPACLKKLNKHQCIAMADYISGLRKDLEIKSLRLSGLEMGNPIPSDADFDDNNWSTN